ncbi:uncharacterized protein LOC106643800 [Copidosoma floridanum]|uniref:uncharacterized protein LOC106643800 n=1 Tax=Copidosoma floridanum TaxID=29053 RepID=UPI0006C99CA2|nr:uncharacterized protein LOC106643800 [Copidosoma floridanum]
MPSKVLPKVNGDKTKIFTNKSMEMTEPIMNCNENENRKQNTNVLPNESMKNSEAISALNTDCIQSRPLVERTPNNTLHAEKSMNTTGTIPIFYKFHHSNHGKFANKLDENQTNIYGNEPMEMTEAVAFYNPIKDQANITGKLVQTHLLEKTNALADASMEMTESVPVPKIYQSKPRVTRIEVLEKTKVFADTSMDMTMTVPVSSAHQYPERVPINKTKVQLSAEQVPVYNTNYECSSQKIDEPLASIISKDSPSPKDLYQEKTQCFNDKSMNITETIPVPQNILLNLQHRQMLADDGAEKTKIFADDSVNITETAPIEQNVSVIKHSKVPLVSDKTRFFNNKSMEITEALPVLLDVRESDKSINPTEEKTKIFSNKSMDLTETFAVLNSYRSTEDGGPHFASRNQMSPIYKVSTIPKSDSNVHYFTSGKNISSNQSFYNNIKSPNNDSMEMTGELSASQAKKTYNCESEKIANQETRKTGNLLKNVPGNLSSSCSRPNNVQNELDISRKSRAGVTDVSAKFMIYEEPDGLAKIFDNASMNLSALPPTATSATNRSRKTNVSHNQSILSTRMDATQNPMNVSSYFNSSIGNDHLDRITSDELNSLCASMNLPIQKYSRENTAMKNSSIPCNDFNALRDSLRNGTLFQQLNILPMQSTSAEIASARNYEIIDSKDNSKTDFEMESCRDASKNMSMSTNVLGAHGGFVNKSTTGQNNFYVFETDMLSKSITTPLIPMETTSEINFKRVPLAEMDVDDTTHLGLKNMTLPRLSSIPMDTDKTAEISLKNVPSAEPSGSHQVFPAPSTLPDRIVSIPEVDKSHSRMDVSMIQEYPPKTAAIVVHNSIKVTDQSAQSSCTVKETLASGDAQSIQAHCKYKVNANPGRIEIYHDVSMEIGGASTSKAYAKRKSDETCEPAAKRNPASQAVCTYMPASESSSKSKNPDDNSLSKMPSDSTEVLLATMGFKTELAYPLIINEKTTIKVSQKPPIDKTFVVTGDPSEENQGETAEHSSAEPNRTFAAVESDGIQTEVTRTDATGTENVESQAEQEVVDRAQAIENGVPHVGIPIVKSPGGRGPVNIEEDDENELDEDKENKEPSVKINLFVEKYSELENIEPPSFLASESFQEEDDLSDITKLPDDDGDEGDVGDGDRPNSSMRILEDDNVIVPFAELENSRKLIASNLSPKPVPQKFQQKLDSNHFSENIMRIRKRRQELLEELKRLSKSDADVKTSKKKANFLEALSVTQDKVDGVQVINENVIKETLSPFEQLTEDLKSFEKRDDCIWSVRKIDTKLIAIDFISKSLVIVIKLTEAKRSDSTKDIEKIEVISRVSVESKNVLMKIVHNILLSKLNPSDMLDKYKVFEDVLLLLEFVSSEVIFAMKFMFDLEKLNALNLLDIDERRVIFMASSRKANIILKLSVALKSFSDIGPDDIDVICILGDVRINDVKQLVVNIRRDYKFLSRYIKDVKDYITLMEESTSFHKL